MRRGEVRGKRVGAKGPKPTTRGAGRPSHYGAPLTAMVPVRLSSEEMAPVRDYCEAHGVHGVALLREAALAEVAAAGGKHLGLGVQHFAGGASAKMGLPALPGERYVLPVGFTAQQRAAVLAHAKRRKVAAGVFLRDAALRFVGRPGVFRASGH